MNGHAKILVLGATGTVGKEVVRILARQGASVRAATRDPARASSEDGGPGTELAEFDLERSVTFAPALRDVDRVFLIARPGDEAPERLACPLIDEMKKRGVRSVVHLSALGAEKREDFGLRKVERYLEGSGLAYTHLRPNWFFQVFSVGALRDRIARGGRIAIPAGDARISFVDARDVAAVAAEVLTDTRHQGKSYAITGAASLDHAEVAAAIAARTGRPVRYEPIGEDAACQALREAGFPPAHVERLLGFYRLVRAGMCAPVSHDVERVLGRAPIPFTRFVDEHAGAWA